MRALPILPPPPPTYSPLWAAQLEEAVMRAVNDAYNVLIDRAFPVGSIYVNDTDDRNPAAIIGRGTWDPHPGISFAAYAWKRIA